MLVCWLWYCAATAVALKRHERVNAFNLVRGLRIASFYDTELDDFALLCAKADKDLFTKVLNSPDHVLHPLLPPPVQQNYNLRNRPHNRQLTERSSRLVDCNFIIRMLYYNTY